MICGIKYVETVGVEINLFIFDEIVCGLPVVIPNSEVDHAYDFDGII